MQKHIITCIFLSLCLWAYTQEADIPSSLKQGLIPSTYNRNALTVVVLENNCSYITDIKQATQNIIIPEKFDDNTVSAKYIRSASGKDAVLNAINQSNLGNQILSTWFSRASDGSFNMALIAERGLYNATVNDMVRASASKLGMDKIRDAGQALVDNSYIQVIEYSDVISMEEYYDRQDEANYKSARQSGKEFKKVSRTKNGWRAKAVSYLFKIDTAYVEPLFNEMWIYEDDDNATKIQKKALFDNTNFPFEYVMMVSHDADGSQDNPSKLTGLPQQLSREQLFAQLINSSISSAQYSFERSYEPFRVKTPLYAVKPIRAKIGTKEGLSVEHRFYVMENVMNAKGKIKAKRQGVIHAKKVANNSFIASENDIPMSKFYQTAGKSLEPGMTLQQRNDYGIGLSTGVATGGMMGFYIKAEGNIASLANMAAGSKNLFPITQLKLFGSLAFDNGNYDSSETSFIRMQVGLSKGFYFWRNFSLVPFVAYGSEQATPAYLLEGYSINGDFLNLGSYFTINLFHNLQFVTTLNYYALLGNAYKQYDGETTEKYDYKYDYYFDGRSGPNLELGLRFEF